MVAGEVLLYAGAPLVATWFTPLMWTGYILLVDGWVASRRGASWLTRRRREFGFLVVLSVLSWLLFEVYNFKLQNWAYVGMPPQEWLRDLGFLWSFGTITPAIFETADGLAAFRRAGPLWPELARLDTHNNTGAQLAALAAVGLAFVVVPPLLPDRLAPYTFAFVWIGYVLLLEPVLLRVGQPSLLGTWQAGPRNAIWRWLAAGLACGLLWELWNVQALGHGGAGWLYTMPWPIQALFFGLHYGRMPVAGLLGFPPFALESFAIYYFLRWVLRIDHVIPKIAQYAQ
jgi:hypothetical protein